MNCLDFSYVIQLKNLMIMFLQIFSVVKTADDDWTTLRPEVGKLIISSKIIWLIFP